MSKSKKIAYFSMEVAYDNAIPNYAGGLGVLAADILFSCADLEIPAVGISLIYHLDDDKKKAFRPEKHLKKLDETVSVTIEGRRVNLEIYKKEIKGRTGHIVPIYFLSANNPANPRWERDLTKDIYSNDWYARLGQEFILGVGGVRALEKMGHSDIDIFHMNEGHSAFLTLELLRTNAGSPENVRKMTTFTSHTPVEAGHDYFDYNMAHRAIGKMLPENIHEIAGHEKLGMTELALALSKKSNSVSEKHKEVCKKMFPHNEFENVTNGIYHNRWIGEDIAPLYDKHLENWQSDPSVFKKAPKLLPDKELIKAKQRAKKRLIEWVNSFPEFFPVDHMIAEDHFDEDILTIGFARRFVPYKRPDLIFHDLDRLREIGYKKIQLIFSSHCGPGNSFCLGMKQTMREHAKRLRGQVKIAVLPNYDLDIAKHLVSGVDIWLNNPIPPMEASGTSGMKVALNAGLNLSILDGWWIEAFEKNPKAGWGFGEYAPSRMSENRNGADSSELYTNLEDAIDCYYNREKEWIKRMKEAISLTADFNTHRVIKEYEKKIWNS